MVALATLVPVMADLNTVGMAIMVVGMVVEGAGGKCTYFIPKCIACDSTSTFMFSRSFSQSYHLQIHRQFHRFIPDLRTIHPSIHPSVHPSVYPFIHLIIDAEKALSKFLLDVSYCVYRSTLDSCAALTTNMVSCLVANFCSSVYCIPRLIIDLFL